MGGESGRKSVAADNGILADNEAQEAICGAGNGGDFLNAAVFLSFFHRGITGSPEPEPGGGRCPPYQSWYGFSLRAEYGNILNRVVGNAGHAEQQGEE